MMYDLCRQRRISHRNTKKWIIAQDEQQMSEVDKIHQLAKSLGVPTRYLSRTEIEEREPDVRAEAGVLESESTGIVDSHAFMMVLEGDFQERGGEAVFNTAVTGLEAINNGECGYRIHVKSQGEGGEEDMIEVESLINSAGLGAIQINNMLLPDSRHRKPFFAKGNYFSYASSHPKPKTLLYPAPVPGHGGLGTHLTLGKIPQFPTALILTSGGYPVSILDQLVQALTDLQTWLGESALDRMSSGSTIPRI